MNKNMKVATGVITLAGAGVIGSQTVQAEEVAKTTEEAPVQAVATAQQSDTKEQVKTAEEKVTEQKKDVTDKQKEADKAKNDRDKANEEAKKQQEQAEKAKQEQAKKEADLEAKRKAEEEAQKKVDEATPENIEKGKETVKTDETNVSNQEKEVNEAKDKEKEEQEKVDEKAKEVAEAKEQAKKDQDALKQAEKEKAEKERIAQNAKAEKEKAEKEKAQKEAELAKKEKEEQEAQKKVTDKEKKVTEQDKKVTETDKKVTDAKKDTQAKKDETAKKEKELKESQDKVDKAVEEFNHKVDEINGHKGIVLPDNFTPDYYDKLSAKEIKDLEKLAQELNKKFPTNANDEAKKNIMIDIYNPTAEQRKNMSEYAVNLINEVRRKFGLADFKVSNQAIKFAGDVAKNSDNTIYAHDNEAINKGAEDNGLSTWDGYNLYENLGNSLMDTSSGKVSQFELERMIRENIVDMLLADGTGGYGHLKSLLREGTRNMGVGISEKSNQLTLKIHFLSFEKDQVVDLSKYDEGYVPAFKTLDELEKEAGVLETTLNRLEEEEQESGVAYHNSQKALKEAVATQTALENQLVSERKGLAEAEKELAQAKTTHATKVEATEKAQNNLKIINTKLKTIDDLIVNREAVLKEAQDKVDEADKVAKESADLLAKKEAELKTAETSLKEAKTNVKEAETKLAELKTTLEHSKKELAHLENAKPILEKAKEAVKKAEEALERAKEEYQKALDHLEVLTAEKEKAEEIYQEAQAKLKEAQQKLDQLKEALEKGQAKLEKEEKHERLEKLVNKESNRLNHKKPVVATNVAWKNPGHTQTTKPVGQQPKVLKSSVIPTGNQLPKTGESDHSLVSYLASYFGILLAGLGLCHKGLKREED